MSTKPAAETARRRRAVLAVPVVLAAATVACHPEAPPPPTGVPTSVVATAAASTTTTPTAAMSAGVAPADSSATLTPASTAATTSPSPPASSALRCASDAFCALDLAARRCETVDDQSRVEVMAPVKSEGEPYCECEAGQCVLREHVAASCSSNQQCDAARKGGRLVPVRRKQPRARPFRPCVDGEVAGECRNGRCEVVAWGC